MVMEVSNSFIEDIFRLVPKNSTILELGSGATTQVLSQRYNIISIEENREYIDKSKSRYIYAPLKEYKLTKQFGEPECNMWYDSDVICKEVPVLEYDALIIDGPSGGCNRVGLWKYRSMFKWDIPIFIDDLHNTFVWRLARNLCREFDIENLEVKEVNCRKCYGILRGDLQKCLK